MMHRQSSFRDYALIRVSFVRVYVVFVALLVYSYPEPEGGGGSIEKKYTYTQLHTLCCSCCRFGRVQDQKC